MFKEARNWIHRLLAITVVLCSSVGIAQQQPNSNETCSKIIEGILKSNRAMADLEELSDDYGPRVTGSENLRRAEQWALDKLQEYGGENVHRETYAFARPWSRGNDWAKLLSPTEMQINVRAMAWNPATKGPATADVIAPAGPIDEWFSHMDDFKGKIILEDNLKPPRDKANEKEQYARFYSGLKTHGALAMLISFSHQDGHFYMLGSPFDYYLEEFLNGYPRIPIGFLQPEDKALLLRQLKRNQKVRIQLNLEGSLGDHIVEDANLVGEIEGTDLPKEIVILAAHLDSWDLATGTTDNGTGSVAILETLRVMKALNLKPRRTIRFVLFTGEEQGEFGSRTYVKAHATEIPNIQAVLVHDLGGGKPLGFTVDDRKDLLPYIAEAADPSASLGVKEFPLHLSYGSDHSSFIAEGVPGFMLIQDTEEYFRSTVHSQTDTFDHVNQKEYLSSIAALASTAWQIANMPDKLPHR